MTTAFDSVLAAAGIPVLGAALYLLMLTLLWRRPAYVRGRQTQLRFCVLVPAHNEQAGIGGTVRSLSAVDYPAHLRRIVVVADNCTDGTAKAAAAEGAEVIERTDTARRGKGWALQYAIDRLLARDADRPEWDALVVVDADTLVERNLLEAMAAHIEAGASAVQAAYLPRKEGRGAVSVITRVAFAAFHLVRSGARERLGLSCGLRGNGMAFRRELLRDVPHTAFSRTEDLEFGVLIGLHGVRVAFAGETRVYGEMPERAAAVTSQRERWIGGRAAMARRYLGALVRGAVTRPSLMLADLALDLVVPPLSVLAVASAAGLAVSVVLAAAAGSIGASAIVWSLASAALFVHVMHAARLAGESRAFLRAAWSLPRYAWDKTMTAARALPRSEEIWVRTPRKGEAQ
jgi:cellulose synthase/poly-beta-1,6-N-acetylglucosamine synthase-like glycosyltransferase